MGPQLCYWSWYSWFWYLFLHLCGEIILLYTLFDLSRFYPSMQKMTTALMTFNHDYNHSLSVVLVTFFHQIVLLNLCTFAYSSALLPLSTIMIMQPTTCPCQLSLLLCLLVIVGLDHLSWLNLHFANSIALSFIPWKTYWVDLEDFFLFLVFAFKF